MYIIIIIRLNLYILPPEVKGTYSIKLPHIKAITCNSTYFIAFININNRYFKE